MKAGILQRWANAVAPASKAYDDAAAPARKTYDDAVAAASRAYRDALLVALDEDATFRERAALVESKPK